MSAPPSGSASVVDGFDLQTPSGLVGFARHVVNGNRLGVLGTVDENGAPAMRWMGTLSLESFPNLFSLTSPHAVKLMHVRDNPNVEWMFKFDNQDIILNLRGKASVVEDTREIKRVWRQIEDKSRAYFLDAFVEGAGMAVLETAVETISCSIPRQDLRVSLKLGPRFASESGTSLSHGPIRIGSLFSAPH